MKLGILKIRLNKNLFRLRDFVYDKGEKFTLYRDIDSLKEYILVDTEKIHVEKHIRHADNSWQLTDYRSLVEHFTIDSVQINSLLKDIYDGVFFE